MTTLLSLPKPTNQSRLEVLGATVRAELAAIGRPTSEMLTHAITIGGALHQARQLVGYGNWEKWLGTECGLSLRTAYTYLRLFAHRARIEEVLQRAAELHQLSIRGALGLIRTGTATRKRTSTSPLKIANWKAATPMQRTTFVDGIPLGRPQSVQDIGHACAYLASDLAANITGEALNVSGGQQMH